jgi:hypothetical protein
VLSFHIFLADHHCQCRVRSQLVVIIEILISQTQPVDPLRHQFFYREFRESRISIIRKTHRKSPDDSRPLFHLPQQQTARVGRDVATVKMTHHFAIS